MTHKKLIMKNILLLFAFIIAVPFTSCKKDNDAPKPQFADIEFTMYDLRATGDTITLEVTYPNTIILKSDYTWTIDLGGAKSNGTYTWTPTSNQQGEIKFTITQWTDFTTNQILSDKLKSVLQLVDNYGYTLSTPSFLNFLDKNFNFSFLRTNRK
jgi:hypothetical protein